MKTSRSIWRGDGWRAPITQIRCHSGCSWCITIPIWYSQACRPISRNFRGNSVRCNGSQSAEPSKQRQQGRSPSRRDNLCSQRESIYLNLSVGIRQGIALALRWLWTRQGRMQSCLANHTRGFSPNDTLGAFPPAG